MNTTKISCTAPLYTPLAVFGLACHQLGPCRARRAAAQPSSIVRYMPAVAPRNARVDASPPEYLDVDTPGVSSSLVYRWRKRGVRLIADACVLELYAAKPTNDEGEAAAWEDTAT